MQFEEFLYSQIISISGITEYVSIYKGNPAVFYMQAPEGAAMPYLVIKDNRFADTSRVIETFTVMIDYWDSNQSSSKSANEIADLIIKQFSNKIFTDCTEYNYLRFWYDLLHKDFSNDPRDILFGIDFEVRGGRKQWTEQY